MKPLLAVLLLLPFLQDPPPETPKPAETDDADLVALAARCGRDVQWRKANDLEAAVDEARKSGRLVFAYVYDRSRSSMFGNRFKDQFMMAGPFADPDLVAYLNRKFVPARFNMNSAFAEEVGTRLNDVIIPAVLFLDPDKKVLHKYDRITSASTELLFATCRSVLEKNSAFDKPGEDLLAREEKVKKNPDDLRARYLLGLELLREAQWDRALAAFSEVVKRAPASREAVESLYRTAGIHRLLRRPAEAAAAVDAALKANAGVGAKIEGDLFLEKARVLLGQGKLDDARKILEGIVKDHPKGTRTPEAAYFLGAVLWSADLEDEAKKAWSGLAKDLEVNPWAKKAAAEALERGPFVNGWEYLEWIDPAALADESKGTERPRKPEEYPQVVDAALEYMLKEQRKDGSWRNVKGQFEFRNCITVIGHMALSAWGDRPAGRNAAARAKARKFIDEWSDKRTDAEGMAIWDHVFALILYARLAPDAADEAAKKDIKKRMKREIRALAAVQRPKGTWSYVGMGPSSFTTGGVMFALWEAKQAGATVDDEGDEVEGGHVLLLRPVLRRVRRRPPEGLRRPHGGLLPRGTPLGEVRSREAHLGDGQVHRVPDPPEAGAEIDRLARGRLRERLLFLLLRLLVRVDGDAQARRAGPGQVPHRAPQRPPRDERGGRHVGGHPLVRKAVWHGDGAHDPEKRRRPLRAASSFKFQAGGEASEIRNPKSPQNQKKWPSGKAVRQSAGPRVVVASQAPSFQLPAPSLATGDEGFGQASPGSGTSTSDSSENRESKIKNQPLRTILRPAANARTARPKIMPVIGEAAAPAEAPQTFLASPEL